MQKELVTWINEELLQRGWSQSEAARRGGISSQMISSVVLGVANPGPSFCRGIARAFGVPEEEVFRRARILSPKLPPAGVDGLVKRLGELPVWEQDTILQQMDALLRLAEARPVYNTRSPKPTTPEP